MDNYHVSVSSNQIQDIYEYIILWDIWVTNEHDYVPYVVIIIWPFPYWWIITVTRVIRQVPQVRSELFILPECMRSSPICRFLHNVFTSLCVLLSFFFWPLYYQFFFDWRLMLTTLLSSSFSSNVIWRGFLFVVIVRFVNIAQSADHHCLSFHFIA
jgi:hypothetical protein